MYTFSNKLRSFSFLLMILGIIGIVYGFLSVPKDEKAVEEYIKHKHAHGHEQVSHDTHAASLHENHDKQTESAVKIADSNSIVSEVVKSDSIAIAAVDSIKEVVAPVVNHDSSNNTPSKTDTLLDEHKEHVKHVFGQLKNKPWAAFYVACIFFLLLTVGVLAYYAIQIAAQAGWSPILFRVMEGITGYLLPGSIIFFIVLVLTGMHYNHLFHWMDPHVVDPKSEHFDKLIYAKKGYLNVPFFLIRAAIFLIGWNIYRYVSRKRSLAQDHEDGISNYKKGFKSAAAFLAFFIVSESIMSWDWIMSVDPHWYSTLFGWYVFASFFVSGITVITLVTLYLKSKGYLAEVNKSHIHDLAKFMFAISIFWTYLWFSQFMLIWYSNIPEEVTYFITRIENYNLPFFGMLVLNFIFPLLILMNADFKRLTWIVVGTGVVILIGHYIDFFNMIMPATVGQEWSIGIPEISSLLFFAGLFIFVVFTTLTKAPLIAKGNPLMEESKHFHY